MEDLIVMQNILKVYPPNVVALDKVSVSFQKGRDTLRRRGKRGGQKHADEGALRADAARSGRDHLPTASPSIFASQVRPSPAGSAWCTRRSCSSRNTRSGRTSCWAGSRPRSFNRLDQQRARQLVKEKIDEFQLQPGSRRRGGRNIGSCQAEGGDPQAALPQCVRADPGRADGGAGARKRSPSSSTSCAGCATTGGRSCSSPTGWTRCWSFRTG